MSCSNTVFGSTTCIQSNGPASASCTSSTGCSATLGSNVTAGHQLIVAYLSRATGPGTLSINDNVGDVFVDSGMGEVAGPTNGGSVQVWVVKSAVGGSTTVTIKPQFTSSGNIVVMEFSGLNSTTPVRTPSGFNSNGTTSTAWTSNAISGALANDLIIGCGSSGVANAPTQGAGFTAIEIPAASASGCEAKVGAGGDAATMTSNSNPFIMSGIAFAPAPTGGGGGNSSWLTVNYNNYLRGVRH